MKTRSRAQRGVMTEKLTEAVKMANKTRSNTLSQTQDELTASPVLARKIITSRKHIKASQTEKTSGEEEDKLTPASPVIAQRALTLKAPKIKLQKQIGNADKENLPSTKNKKYESLFNRVLSPLRERNNVPISFQETKNASNMISKKDTINHTKQSNKLIDKENLTSSTVQPVTRRSTRNRKTIPAPEEPKTNEGDKTDLSNGVFLKPDDMTHRVKKQTGQGATKDTVRKMSTPAAVPQIHAQFRNRRNTANNKSTEMFPVQKEQPVLPIASQSKTKNCKSSVLALTSRNNTGTASSSANRYADIKETPKGLPALAKKNTLGYADQKAGEKSGLSHGLPAASNIRQTSITLSSPACSTKSKLPVWASVQRRRTSGSRKSMRKSSEAYEFSVSPTKAGMKKKVKTRTKARQKRPKPRTKFTTFLTTDPNFESNFPNVSSFSKSNKTQSKKYTSSGSSQVSDTFGDDELSAPDVDGFSIGSVISDIHADGIDIHEEVFDEFEGETASSFVIPQPRQPKISPPMTSASALPTPVVSKHISKFIGGSSTPRVENTILSKQRSEAIAPLSVSADIAICFGFESEPETAEEVLNLSPVRRSGFQNSLEVTGSSDIHMKSQSSKDSYQFYRGNFKYGNNSSMSLSCASSVSTQGRSISSVSEVSTKSQLQVSKDQKYTVLKKKQNPALKKGRSNLKKRKTENHPPTQKTRVQPNRIVHQESCDYSEEIDTSQDAEMSVLFDDEEALEKQPTLGDKQKKSELTRYFLSKPTDRVASLDCPSPNKSFSKPARRSYNRTDLNESRRSFIKTHGGYATTETDTDTEDKEPIAKPQKRKKTAKATKKGKQTNTMSQESSLLNNTTKKAKSSAKSQKDKIVDKSVNDWASHLNSHFSEVDDTFLVVS